MTTLRTVAPFNRFWHLVLVSVFTVLLLGACRPADAPPEPVEEPATVEATAAPIEEASPETPAANEGEATDATQTGEAVAPAATESAAAALPPTLGVVSVGINPAFEPFVFMDENGQLVGFDVDLVNALAAAANFEVGYSQTSFGGLFDGLQSGVFDIAIGAITITDERKQIIDFTDQYYRSGQSLLSYYDAGQGIAVPVDNTTILGPDDLTEEMRVGVKANTTGERFVVDQTAAQFARYQEAPDALRALAAGEVDAVVVDIPVITDFVRKDPNAGVKLTGGPVTTEEYGIAVAKAKPGIRDGLNVALAQIREDGTYDAIFQKWFGTP